MNELTWTASVERGAQGPDVKRVQEWLCLGGFGVQLDSEFGPATQSAVRAFQKANGLTVDGIVGAETWAKLVTPLRNALAPIAPAGRGLGAMVVAWAQQQLAQRPREVGGDNCGPWVRLYMNGHDGARWRWCAGFACFCLRQACAALGVALPITPSFSCDLLASSARHNGRLVDGDAAGAVATLAPGSLFLVRRPDGDDWIHTGIVTTIGSETFGTIEGNTNEGGSANGYEVAARTRAYASRDFIRMG
jgi:hypothetical protein